MNTLVGQLLPADGLALHCDTLDRPVDVTFARAADLRGDQPRFPLLYDHVPAWRCGQAEYLHVDSAGRTWLVATTDVDELDARRYLSAHTRAYRLDAGRLAHIGITEASLVADPASAVRPAWLCCGDVRDGTFARPTGIPLAEGGVLDRARSLLAGQSVHRRSATLTVDRHGDTELAEWLARAPARRATSPAPVMRRRPAVSHDEAAAAAAMVGARGYVYDDDRHGRVHVHSAGRVLSFE